MRGEGHRNTRQPLPWPSKLGCMSASWQRLHIKILHWGLTSGPWNPCWVHVHLDVALFQAIRKYVAKFNKNRTRSFYSLLLKNIESNRKRKEMEPSWEGLTSSHLDTETAKPSEPNCLIKHPWAAEELIRNALFGPHFLLFLPWDLSFLLFVLSFWSPPSSLPFHTQGLQSTETNAFPPAPSWPWDYCSFRSSLPGLCGTEYSMGLLLDKVAGQCIFTDSFFIYCGNREKSPKLCNLDKHSK